MKDLKIETPIESAQIEQILPHRYPFLLIDRIISYELEPEITLTAIKNVTVNEPFFTGHFPGNPVMPGVLIIESMAQACGMLAYLAMATEGNAGGVYYLVKVDNARFTRKVVPGDQLQLEVKQTRIMRGMGKYEAVCKVDGKMTASCELMCASG